MTNLELVLNMLVEASTTEVSKKKKPEGLNQNKAIAKQGGKVAKAARKEIELNTGESIISSDSMVKKYLNSRVNNARFYKRIIYINYHIDYWMVWR